MKQRMFAGLICLALTGCGGAEVKRVTGQVLVDGQPVEKVTVCFQPSEDIRLGMMVCHYTDAEGCFDIFPEPEYGEGRAGLFRVTVIDRKEPMKLIADMMILKEAPQMRHLIRVPPLYWNMETTPLQTEIHKGVNQLDPFELHWDQ